MENEQVDLLTQIAHLVRSQLIQHGFTNTTIQVFPDFEKPGETKAIISIPGTSKSASFKPQLAIDLEQKHYYEDGILEVVKMILDQWA
jgi:hypothetical protein